MTQVNAWVSAIDVGHQDDISHFWFWPGSDLTVAAFVKWSMGQKISLCHPHSFCYYIFQILKKLKNMNVKIEEIPFFLPVVPYEQKLFFKIDASWKGTRWESRIIDNINMVQTGFFSWDDDEQCFPLLLQSSFTILTVIQQTGNDLCYHNCHSWCDALW